MQTLELIREIRRLPLSQQFFVMEEMLKSIKKEETQRQLALAAEELYQDYMNDQELTAFTTLDLEEFYEAK